MIDEKQLITWVDENKFIVKDDLQNELSFPVVEADELISSLANNEFGREPCSECEFERETSENSAWCSMFYKFCRFCGRKLREEDKQDEKD